MTTQEQTRITPAELIELEKQEYLSELEKRLIFEVRMLRSVLIRIENPALGSSSAACRSMASKALNNDDFFRIHKLIPAGDGK